MTGPRYPAAYRWRDGGSIYCPGCYDLDMFGIDADELAEALDDAGQGPTCCDCKGPFPGMDAERIAAERLAEAMIAAMIEEGRDA